MSEVFEKLIFPNIMVTESDIEQFETSPDTFIANDLEEADSETRRRNCLNLVRVLSRTFSINETVMDIAKAELIKYNKSPKENWTLKVNIINLLIGAHANQYTLRTGATVITVKVEELQELIKTIILPELEKTDDMSKESSFIKAACIKYLFIFRSHIPHSWIIV